MLQSTYTNAEIAQIFLRSTHPETTERARYVSRAAEAIRATDTNLYDFYKSHGSIDGIKIPNLGRVGKTDLSIVLERLAKQKRKSLSTSNSLPPNSEGLFLRNGRAHYRQI